MILFTYGDVVASTPFCPARVQFLLNHRYCQGDYPLAQMLHAWATKKGTAISAGGTQNMGAQKAGCCRHIR
jgi:hypothetical protein